MEDPLSLVGVVSRFCNNYAKYDPAVYECTSEFIRNISNKVRIVSSQYANLILMCFFSVYILLVIYYKSYS